MVLSEWLMIALMAVIIIVGLSLFFYLRHKLRKADDFEGIIDERGKTAHIKNNLDPEAELEQLERELAEKQ